MKIRTHNKSSLKEIRRQLRSEMTPAEKLLWRKLQAGRFKELKFRRQHSIGNYIVDFYCPKYRLVIELDGKVHLEREQAEKDKFRDEHLKDMDYLVLRFTNDEVLNDYKAVLNKILDEM